MIRKKFFNFFYLAIFFHASSSFAQCIYNLYGHELCIGDTVIETTYGEENLRPVRITGINYNLIEIKYKNDRKVEIAPEALIGKRDCNLTDSIFCQRHQVEIKPECQDLSGKYIAKEFYYGDYILLENKTLFKTKRAIAKTECLIVKDI